MDKQKADRLITEYLPKIYGFSISKCFGYDEAEDLCSDIVYELYRSMLAADEIYNTDGYVWRISMHVFSKYVSSKKKHQGISIDGMDIPVQDEYFDGEKEQLLRLRREISFLSKVRREIVYSYYYENKSILTIAAEMDLPIGTVKWHLSKAKKELREGLIMERNIGKLGLKPVEATEFGHNGNPGDNSGPEFYLGDRLNLNIVYSVYHEPRTRDQIAEELGVSPAFIDEKIRFLEENGFLVPISGKRYTTFVEFNPESYSLEEWDRTMQKKLNAAKILAADYVQRVCDAIADYPDVYIPSGNRELLEAAAVFYGVLSKCNMPMEGDLSKYRIKTTAGGDFVAYVNIPSKPIDPDYAPKVKANNYFACGHMNRWSSKYPVYSWSVDTKYTSRKGFWENNLTSDYEYLYELMTGRIADDLANAEKFQRLRERGFITEDNKVSIMVIKGDAGEFFARIPELDEATKRSFANDALESAEMAARWYPPQMKDLVVHENGALISGDVAVMVMDILYESGIFRPLTEAERVASHLILFTDRIPNGN